MELEFRPDFEEVQARWERFWRGESPRPHVYGVAPKPGVEPVPKPGYTAGHDGNFGPVIDQALRWAETHEFVGDAIPFFQIEFGADHFVTFLGADLRFQEGSVRETGNSWAVPFVEDWDETEIRFRRDTVWWERAEAFAHELRRRCDGRLLIAAPTFVANTDALAAIRGRERFLIDLVERPEAIQRALEQVNRAYAEVMDAWAELLDYETWGSINRHGMYCRGRINLPQCDMSCMISPRMFRELVLPALRFEFSCQDAGEYHLDGPGAIKHLEALCEIEDLDVVQWIAGAGEASTQDWTDLYHRIDDLGKGHLRWADAGELPALKEEFGSNKVYCLINAPSGAEIERAIEQTER